VLQFDFIVLALVGCSLTGEPFMASPTSDNMPWPALADPRLCDSRLEFLFSLFFAPYRSGVRAFLTSPIAFDAIRIARR
jgi:hypothetical protein